MKKHIFKSHLLSIFFLALILVGNVQTKDKTSSSIFRTMNEIICNLAREKNDFFSRLSSSEEPIEALADDSLICRDTERKVDFSLLSRNYNLNISQNPDMPSGRELYSIFRSMADYGLLNQDEKEKVTETMLYTPVHEWKFKQLPQEVRKKINVIYQIAKSPDPHKLVFTLTRNSNLTISPDIYYNPGSSEHDLPPSQKMATEKNNKERDRIRQNFKSNTEFTRNSWARVYGDILNDGVECIQQTNDGGYIAAGYSSFLLGPSDMDAWLIKFSPEGKIQWQRAYGGTGVDWASFIQQTPDEGYIVAGYTSPSDMLRRDFWVLKLDSAGNIEWQKAYGGSTEDWAASIDQTGDGGYIVAGITTSFGAGDYDFWILKLSPNGDIEWQRAYGGEKFDSAQSIQQTRDGGYIVTGYSSSFVAQYADIWLLKLSNNGDIEWQRTYGGDGSEWTTSIQQTNDGGYILAGYSSSFSPSSGDIWVLKLFPNGDIEWQRAYKGNESDGAHSIQQTRDGGYIVAGFTESFGAGGRDVWILKLNSIGEIEWQRTYGGNGDDWAHFIQQTSDGGYIVAGKTISLLGRGGGDLLILKIDSAGWIERVPEFIGDSNAEVLDTSIIPQDTNVTPRDTNIAAQVTNNMSPYTSERDNLLFSPPLNLIGNRISNRSLSQAEYIDLLTWEANPNNNDLNIVKYRVYRIEGEKRLLAELDAQTFRYIIRKVWKGIENTYAVSGVTDQNEEGIPAFITVK